MGTEARLDAVYESTKGDTVVPICGEIGDILVWNLRVDPCKHSILGRYISSCAADLEMADEGPDES